MIRTVVYRYGRPWRPYRQCVTIERTWDPEYGFVYTVSDKNGEIDASTDLTKALLYVEHAFKGANGSEGSR